MENQKVILGKKIHISSQNIRGSYKNPLEISPACKKNLLQNKNTNYEYNPFLNKNAIRTIKECVTNFVEVAQKVNQNKKANNDNLDAEQANPTHKSNPLPALVYKSVICNSNKKEILNLVTLTLPSVSDLTPLQIKRKVLNSFLTDLRQYEGLKNYVWVQEYQKNGNLHFHIITDSSLGFCIVDKNNCAQGEDTFQDFTEAHKHLSKIYPNQGYNLYRPNHPQPIQKNISLSLCQQLQNKDKSLIIKRSNNFGSLYIVSKFAYYWNKYLIKNSMMQDFHKNNGHQVPPSANTKPIQNAQQAAKYITKYITKNGNSAGNPNLSAQDNGRLWGISNTLKCFEGIDYIFPTGHKPLDPQKQQKARQQITDIYECRDNAKFSIQNEFCFFLSYPCFSHTSIFNLFIENLNLRLQELHKVAIHQASHISQTP